MSINISFVKLHEDSILPEYKTSGSSGFDFYCVENFSIRPGQVKLVSTGLQLAEMTSGYEIQIRPRSGLATKGITILNSPGTVDSDYRGEIKLILYNCGNNTYIFNKGDRIAQGVVCSVKRANILLVKDITQTERGDGGFGSTGR